MGLNVKLDVGLYRLDQQIACQRYRQQFLDAISRTSERVKTLAVSVKDAANSLFAPRLAFSLI